MSEAVKVVIFDQGTVKHQGKKLRKYLIGTIVVTDKEIHGIEDGKEYVAMTATTNSTPVSDVFSNMPKFKPPFALGELGAAMLVVSNLTPDDLLPVTPES